MCGRLDSSIGFFLVILASSSLPRSNAILAFISLLRRDDRLLPNSVWYLMMPFACATMSLISLLHIDRLNYAFRQLSLEPHTVICQSSHVFYHNRSLYIGTYRHHTYQIG